jgi:hypothetical protein
MCKIAKLSEIIDYPCQNSRTCSRNALYITNGGDMFCCRHIRDYDESYTRTAEVKLSTSKQVDEYPCQFHGNCTNKAHFIVRGDHFCERHINEYVECTASQTRTV